jgi:hypothetical protein
MEDLVDLQQMAQVKRQQEIDLPPDAMSIDLLRAVYRNPTLDLPVRMRAAALAIGYECPKLQMVAQVSESSFATLLDRRIENLKRIEENRANGKVIEAAPVNGGEADARLPPRLPDRRFRRI